MTAILDETLSAPTRLKICGYLSGCTEADFKVVQDYCAISQSSLSKHLTTLSDKGYVEIRKVSAARYTKTRLSLTDAGRRALGEHVEYLRSIAESVAQG
ncbi:transcriptional regulator [Rhodococcoides trifolii]|uniref:Transcriptional regulator n=1 Tax=Rhodococcoides trifolii TaxID=908250 RepID=A0A917CJ29_9NOCA|nr:transcriptional regulator [Rhodococcus trifolii]GGF90496.1 transcriptional regulator [Rhodococcus trifolii]